MAAGRHARSAMSAEASMAAINLAENLSTF